MSRESCAAPLSRWLSAAALVSAQKKTMDAAALADGQPDFRATGPTPPTRRSSATANSARRSFSRPKRQLAYAKKREQIENSQSKDDIHYDNVIWQNEKYAKVVTRNRTSIIYDPPDGRIPDLTPAAKALVAARAAEARLHGPSDAADSRSLGERCISWGNEGPPMVGSTYQANLQIVQTKNAFVIRHEIMHGVRIIPVDGTPHVAKNVRMLFGDSRGRWEGDTLVVDTTELLRPHAVPRSAGDDAAGHLHEPRSARHRAFHAGGRRHDPLSLHGRRPGDVRQAVVGRDGDAEDGGPAVRVRVPRRQLRPREHPQRGARRRTISRRPDRTMKTRLAVAVVAGAALSTAALIHAQNKITEKPFVSGGAHRAVAQRGRLRGQARGRQSHPRHDHRRDGQHEGRIDRERHAGQGRCCATRRTTTSAPSSKCRRSPT